MRRPPRRATVDDLAPIMALETSVFASDAWSEASMRSELADRNSYYLVVPDGDDLVAYAGLRSPPGQGQADIQTIAVSSNLRRTGLGRLLMEQLIAEATARGAGELFLEVRDDNQNARTLYDSLGFEQIAVRQKYYQPDGVDAVVMRLAIVVPG